MSNQEQIRQMAIGIIDQQVQRENNNPDDSYKACIWALHCLRSLVENYPADERPAEQFTSDLIDAMRTLQQQHDSDFTDDYNSAKATMGSVINNLEYETRKDA